MATTGLAVRVRFDRSGRCRRLRTGGNVRGIAFAAIAGLALAGCTGGLGDAKVARGDAAYKAMDVAESGGGGDYRIGALDTLAVSVFQEPDLSTPSNAPLQVNASGNITMPLIGTVPAAGKTASELSALIAERLSVKYLENPQVNVSVATSVSQKVTVQGEVVEAGIFPMNGKTTLLDAISLAKGESKVASLKQVLVYRYINGQRTGALFDVLAIRKGEAPDPEILGNDVVVVGYSKGKAIWRDILSTSPLLGIFRPF